MPARKNRYGKFGTVDPTKPMFTHDCDSCVFLGHYHDTRVSMSSERRAFDLYWCEQGGLGATVIARYSDEGSEYWSGLGMRLSPLVEAEARAAARHLPMGADLECIEFCPRCVFGKGEHAYA